MNTQSHLEESLQRDIDLIKAKVKEMGDRSVSALNSSVQALIERNRRLAYLVILRDRHIDELETELDKLCLEFLVRHQPAGSHLRLVYAAIQINKELERIGDYAESIAKQNLAVSSIDSHPPQALFNELGSIATQMVGSAVEAFLRQDSSLAWRTMELEESANTLRNSINSQLNEMSQSGRLPATAVGPFMTVARRLERAADQAKNICEEVLYLCTGEFIKHKAAEGFRILFIDSGNSVLSQMGEAIGNSLKLPRFSFGSAGLEPQPVNKELIEFLSAKGFDVAGLASKSLQQLPHWESSQVIVTLDPRVRDHLSGLSAKTITLAWSVEDPALQQGSPSARQEAFETARQFLESNIRDLAGAILESPTVST